MVIRVCAPANICWCCLSFTQLQPHPNSWSASFMSYYTAMNRYTGGSAHRKTCTWPLKASLHVSDVGLRTAPAHWLSRAAVLNTHEKKTIILS